MSFDLGGGRLVSTPYGSELSNPIIIEKGSSNPPWLEIVIGV